MAGLADPERLQALQLSGLLDRDTAARLHHLVFAAATLARADAAQLNVIDENSQHHVSEWPVVEDPRPPLDVNQAGCREVVLSEVTVCVEDTMDHPIMCLLPWAQSWRGYLGTPVRYQGHVVGALCVLSREPRAWSLTDRLGMEGVARLIGMSLT